MNIHFTLARVSVTYSRVIVGTLNLHIPSELHTHESKDIGPLLQSVISNTDITNFPVVTPAKSAFLSITLHIAIQI